MTADLEPGTGKGPSTSSGTFKRDLRVTTNSAAASAMTTIATYTAMEDLPAADPKVADDDFRPMPPMLPMPMLPIVPIPPPFFEGVVRPFLAVDVPFLAVDEPFLAVEPFFEVEPFLAVVAETGFAVTGAAVTGAAVTGAGVTGAGVTGAAVVGADVAGEFVGDNVGERVGF